jgi:hypothetical protein
MSSIADALARARTVQDIRALLPQAEEELELRPEDTDLRDMVEMSYKRLDAWAFMREGR